MSKITDFVSLLEGQVESGIYVWGGDGEILTDMSNPRAWITDHEAGDSSHTKAQNAARAVALYQKRVAAGIDPVRAFDCGGLMYWALKTLGLQRSDLSSRGLYGICSPVAQADLRAGDLVFVYTDRDGDGFDVSEIHHVGAIVDSDLHTVECIGRDYGVVRRNFSSRWNAFGRPRAFAAETVDEPASAEDDAPAADAARFARELRYGCTGEDVCALKALLAAAGYDSLTVSNPRYRSATRRVVRKYQQAHGLAVDGIAGQNTITALGGIWEG